MAIFGVSHSKDWVDILSALLTPTIAIAATIIGALQWHLNRERIRLEIFDRRYAKFDAARRFISSIITEAKVDEGERKRYLNEIYGTQFLFSTEIAEYVYDLHKRACQLHAIQQQRSVHGIAPGKYSDLVDKEHELIVGFSTELDVLDQRFHPYLATRFR